MRVMILILRLGDSLLSHGGAIVYINVSLKNGPSRLTNAAISVSSYSCVTAVWHD